MEASVQTARILGIDFYNGSVEQALETARNEGGLILAPSGPGLAELGVNPYYDTALQQADINLVDSAYLALLWRKRTGESIQRHSGLKFLKALIDSKAFKQNNRQLWVMPDQEHQDAASRYLLRQHITLSDQNFYQAPNYTGPLVEDIELLAVIRERRPDYVILTIAGGKQEVLGHWLREKLDYEPTILCIGAAIAFLSGKQANIPAWADRIYIGWFLRILSNPQQFLPRYWKARRLKALVDQWGENAPKV